MGKYNFDEIHNRKNTGSIKWDFGKEIKGRDDLLPLWVADMDFKLPDEILSDITDRTMHGIFGYTNLGESYLGPVRGWLKKRHGIQVSDKEIIVAPGIVFSIALAIRAFTNPGDSVLIQQPVYHPFTEKIQQNNRRVVNNQLIYADGRYEIDFPDFEKKIVENDVKLFILCSPHNPVGRVWTKEELLRIADICLEHNVYIFSDEIHADFVYEGNRHTSFYALGEKYHKNLILGTAASKTFNLAGIQVANIIIPDDKTNKTFKDAIEATGFAQPNVLGMVATASAYQKGEEWLDELILYLQGNRDYVRSFLAKELPAVRLVEPEGTYLLWLDFSGVVSDKDELERLITDKARLWLNSGETFGKETALFQRMNIACPRKTLEQAMEQLREALDQQ